MIVIHGQSHGASGNGVIPVAQSIGQGLVRGTRRIYGLVFPYHFAGDDAAGDWEWHMIHEKGFAPAQEREGMTPVLAVVRKVSYRRSQMN